MRNLKRALSLALASVMLLGMMVVGASAASYPDVDDTKNVEAIEVLQTVGAMVGDDQGNFRPDAGVNRHEMAAIMARLVLGTKTADEYVGSHPFTDVVPWADKYVAACYENGLINGTSATTFGGNQPLTAVQAAAMMMRALGYKDLSKNASDWRAPVTAEANKIRLFSGVATNPSESLNRNQVAQLALNTLKSPVVDTVDGTFDITSGEGNVTITGGARQYIARSSREAYAQAINRTESQGTSASSIGGYTIELGEHLYNGKLKLNDSDYDVFGRPARRWEYDGKEIGKYAKTELMTKEYVGKVTGRDLYDLLGSAAIDTYSMTVTIDGVSANANTYRAQMDRNNKDGLVTNPTAVTGKIAVTGTGTLTQVFVDGINKIVDVAIINTYLAQATKDYDAKKEELTVEIYCVNGGTGDYVKSNSKRTNVKLDLEDLPAIQDVKKDTFLMVNVAGSDVAAVEPAEVLSAVTVSSFKSRSNVTVDGQKYDFAHTAWYDDATLAYYTGDGATQNLKDTTYNIYLDSYGNLLGIKEVEAKKNYVFIAGVDSSNSNIVNKTGRARALFLDGTSDVITYDAEKSSIPTPDPLMNTWCTYTKNTSDVYTLTEVRDAGQTGYKVPANVPNTTGYATTNLTKLAQFAEYNLTDDRTIDKQNISVDGGGTSAYSKVYGNKDTVYLTAKLGNVTKSGVTYGIISGVDNVTVGAEKANLLVWDYNEAGTKYKVTSSQWSAGTYALYNDNGIIIAAVVVGEDSGAAKNLVYAHTSSLEQEAYGQSSTRTGSDEWTWTRKVIKDGEEVLLTERGDSASYLRKMQKGNWYEVKMNTSNEVIDANRIVTVYTDATHKDASGLDEILMDSGKTRFIADNTLIGDTVSESGVDTVLYCQRFTNDQLTTSGWTLYVTTKNSSGFLVHENAKIVVQQYDRNTQELYVEEYVGANNLKGIVDEITERNKGTKSYNYQVSAVLDKGVASSVVINSEVTDWAPGAGGSASGSGVYYTYEATVFSSGVARVTVTASRPEWLDDAQALPFTYDVLVNGKKYEERSGVSIASSDKTKDDFYTVGGGVRFDPSDVITIDNFKFTSLNAKNYKIQYIDKATGKVIAVPKTGETKPTDILDEDTTKTITGTSAATVSVKVNSALYRDGGTIDWTATGLYDDSAKKNLDKGTTAALSSYAANISTSAIAATADGKVLEDYVKITLDLSKLTDAAPTYKVTLSGKTAMALSTKGVTDATDKVKTLTVAVTGAAAVTGSSIAMEKTGLGYNAEVTVTVTLSADPAATGVFGYKVSCAKLDVTPVILYTGNLTADWKFRVTEDVTINPEDFVVQAVGELKITGITWNAGEIRVTFNKAVKSSTASGVTYTGSATAAAAVVDANDGRVVVIKATDGDFAADETLTIATSVEAADEAGNTVTTAVGLDGAATPGDVTSDSGFTATLAAGGKATVAAAE